MNTKKEITGTNLPDMPENLKKLIQILKAHNKGIDYRPILNIVLSKLAGMVTAKRIKCKEIENLIYPNYYAINFMPSGFGKDRMTKDIDNHVMKKFYEWHSQKKQDYLEEIRKQIINDYNQNFPDEKQEVKRQEYVNSELSKFRNIVHEVSDGTREGFFADAKAIKNADFGSLNLKLSELGLFLKNATSEQKQFINQIYEAYDGKIVAKSIKGEDRQNNIENIPVNTLMQSDPVLFQKDIKQIFNSLMETGLGRRSVLTFMNKKLPYQIETDSEKAYEKERKYYEYLQKIGFKIYATFSKIEENSIYDLTPEAYQKFHEYKIKLKILEDMEENSLLNKEIVSRELKSLKLSCLYACISHPCELCITPEDMEQAIDTIEYLSKDFRKFLNYKPKRKDSYDFMFDFFLENIGKEFTKTQLVNDYRQEFNFSRDFFRKEFDICMSTLKEFALLKGYFINEKIINRGSGRSYSMIKIENEPLSSSITPLEQLINT